MEKLLSDFPAVTVTSEGLARVSHGQQVRASDLVGRARPRRTRPSGCGLLDRERGAGGAGHAGEAAGPGFCIPRLY